MLAYSTEAERRKGAGRRHAKVAADPSRLPRAFFKARLSWVKAAVPRREKLLLRLVPALIHARFPTHGFDGEPLGLIGAKTTVGWSRTANRLELPPPNGIARLSQTVESLWILHTVEGLEVLVLPPSSSSAEELARVERRLQSIASRIEDLRFEVPLRFRVLTDLDVTRDVRLQERMILFGALVHGPLPTAWARSSPTPSPAERLRLAELACSPVTILALLLASASPLESPLSVWKEALSEGLPARTLAHPALGLALWLGRAHLDSGCLVKAVAWSPDEDPSASFRARQLIDGAHRVPEPTVLADEARRLTRAVIGARRPHRGEDRARAQKLLVHELLPQGFPRVLLPALRSLLEGVAEHWVEVETGPGVEIVDQSGYVLASERTSPQAWVRAVVLTQRARGKSPFPHDIQGVWRAVADMNPALRTAPDTLLLAIRAIPLEGLPGDPLNRGEQRQVSFEPGLSIRLRPHRRPCARTASPEELVQAVTGTPHARYTLEILAESAESQPAVARLRRLGELAERAHRDSLPLVVEAGGKLLRTHPGARAPALQAFARRPLLCCVDAESPDLPVFQTVRRQATKSAPSVSRSEEINAFVSLSPTLAGEGRACILYTDARGYHLRETVPLRWLDAHLDDTQTLLRSATAPFRLLLRSDEQVEQAVRRAVQAELPPLEVELLGEMPFQVQLKLAGEFFGGARARTEDPFGFQSTPAPTAGGLGWAAAALSVLSRCQPGLHSRVRVNKVSVWAAGAPVTGLLALYVRSMAMRRLDAQMRLAERA